VYRHEGPFVIKVHHQQKHQNALFNFKFCSGTRPSYLVDVLRLGILGPVGARNDVRSSFSQCALSMPRNDVRSSFSQCALSMPRSSGSFDLESNVLPPRFNLQWPCPKHSIHIWPFPLTASVYIPSPLSTTPVYTPSPSPVTALCHGLTILHSPLLSWPSFSSCSCPVSSFSSEAFPSSTPKNEFKIIITYSIDGELFKEDPASLSFKFNARLWIF